MQEHISGALILNEEGNWRLNVHCTNREDCLLQSIPVEESEVIPLTLINYVKRTKETLIFDYASNEPSFASTPTSFITNLRACFALRSASEEK